MAWRSPSSPVLVGHAPSRLAVVAVAAMTLECVSPRTEILVTIDSDLPVGLGGVIQSLSIEVRSDGVLGALRQRRVWPPADGTTPIRLPMSFSLSPQDQDNAQTLWIEINACPDARGCGPGGAVEPLVTRRAVVTYVPHVLADMRLVLAASCQGVTCPSEQTCRPDTRRCVSAVLRIAGAPQMDASVDRAADGPPGMDASDGGDDGPAPVDGGCPGMLVACDGLCVSLESTEHCGACGVRCPDVANARSVCVEGACQFRCAPTHVNCDGMQENGCEAARATDLANCGRCGYACAADGGEVTCSAGACTTLTCPPGTADCNERASDGCEADPTNDPLNCGVCNYNCRVRLDNVQDARCVNGVCRAFRCSLGYGDCDGDRDNGCETDLSTAANCGSCGTHCRAGRRCVAGRCECRVGDVACGSEDEIPACGAGRSLCCPPSRPNFCDVEGASCWSTAVNCATIRRCPSGRFAGQYQACPLEDPTCMLCPP